MPPRTASSGHSKLKQSLVLRDYLLNRLGLDLATVTRRLRDTENLSGAECAFVEGRYVESLSYLSSRHSARIAELDTLVRESCLKAKFTPRYFQYLSLIFASEHLDRLFTDRELYLEDLNAFHDAWVNKRTRDAVAPFTAEDLQRLAFWMATAAGKTHILHACLTLAGQKRFDRIILITPTEQLSRQHAESLRKHCQQPVFVYPLDGDASQISHLLPGTVLIIDINKLTDNKQGEGVSLDAGVFKESRNLVFVDEGHKGQKSEGSVWKRIQQSVAGVGHPQECYQGLLIEFSATFGQVAEAEHAFDQYAKSVVYDYAYDRFHADLYGKDFQVLNLKGNNEGQHEEVLAASLVTYWHQMNTFRNPDCVRELQQNTLQVEAPLWVLLGLSVIGGNKNEDEKEQTSDVIKVILFLKMILAEGGLAWLANRIEHFASDSGKAFLPGTAREAIIGKESRNIADQLMKSVFGYTRGSVFVLRHLKTSPGEVGLGLSMGNRVHYFGVVNVGDSSGLATALETHGIEVETDVFRDSLFAALEHGDSGINLLIGSRRFSEGWNNYRASTLTLLRLGSGEGPLIIQMFGRVVRFRGKGDMKRLATPGMLAPLQTAYVFGLRADYMEKFLVGLTANGIDTTVDKIKTSRMSDEALRPLKRIKTIEATRENFQLEAMGGSRWYDIAGNISLSLQSAVHCVEMVNGELQTDALITTESITEKFKEQIVPVLDYDRLLFKLLEFRNTQGWWNFSFDADALKDALKQGRYNLEGTPYTLRLVTRYDLERHHHIALNLLQRMVRSAYRRSEAKKTGYHISLLAPPHEALVITEIEIRKVQA
ncbi:MAG: DEAD/DEAH box helicase family protein [Proteobacteria bacterium]|nr:DEAD/DEAH box helicase family protein [Pseudomonadota bacterium]